MAWQFVPWTIQYMVSFVVILIAAFFVLYRSRKTLPSIYFFIFGILLSIWQVVIFLHRNAPNEPLSKSLLSVGILFAIFGGSFILVTVMNIPKKNNKALAFTIPPLIAGLYVFIQKPFTLSWNEMYGWTYTPTNPTVIIWVAITFFYSIIIIALSVHIWNEHPSLRKKMSLIVFSFIGIDIFGTLISNIWLSFFPNSPPVGGVINTTSFLIIGYALLMSPESKITLTGTTKLSKVYYKFLKKLYHIMPGKELGSNIINFGHYIDAMGMKDFIALGKKEIKIEEDQLTDKLIKEIPDNIMKLLKEDLLPEEISEEFKELFLQTYQVLYNISEEEANRWLYDMIDEYGFYLKKYGVLDSLPEDVDIPNIIDELEMGGCYLMEDNDRLYKILDRAISMKFEGLIFTKLKPEKIKEKYDLDGTDIYQTVFQDDGNTIPPTELNRLKSKIRNFYKDSDRNVMAVDCVDQIMYANGLDKTSSFLKTIKKNCEKEDGIVLISMDPSLFEKEQLEKIEKLFGY